MLCPDKRGAANLACLKNRHGEPVDLEMAFDGSVQRFEVTKGGGDYDN